MKRTQSVINRIAGVFLALAIVAFAMSIATADAFVYVLCLILLGLAVLFALLVLATNLIWKLLPPELKNTYKIERSRFNGIILCFAPLLLIFAKAVHKNYLYDASGALSVLANIGILVFAVFLIWNFIKKSRWRTILVISGVFALFIALLSFVSTIAFKLSGGVDAEANPLAALGSLGYVDWVSAEDSIEKVGVVQYDRQLTFDGLNLFNSWTLPEAYLIDMRGNIVHKWAKKTESLNSWAHVELCEGGDVLVVALDRMLIRLDWDSNVKWEKRMRVHHDAFVDENQKVYVLGREDALVFWHWIPAPILSDYVAVLSTNGTIEKKVYIYDMVKEQFQLREIVGIYREILNSESLMKMLYRKATKNYIFRHGTRFDIMHTNRIEVLGRDIEGFCKKGDWLISIRQLDLIGIIDSQKEEFVWLWGPGQLSQQHHPTLLDNGNVLIFDNGVDKGRTRIVELDPLTKEIVWEYKSNPPEKFFSLKRGSCQRLPNGNTLITESEKGHVFEITKEGKVVWEFYNPKVRAKDKKRETIYRMIRITSSEKYNMRKQI